MAAGLGISRPLDPPFSFHGALGAAAHLQLCTEHRESHVPAFRGRQASWEVVVVTSPCVPRTVEVCTSYRINKEEEVMRGDGQSAQVGWVRGQRTGGGRQAESCERVKCVELAAL